MKMFQLEVENRWPKYLMAAAGIIVVIYCYLMRKFQYWSSQRVRGPPPTPLFGNVIDPWFKRLDLYEEENLKRYGKVYGIYEGTKPVLRVADPELIKKILVKDFQYFVNHRPDPFNEPAFDNHLFGMHEDRWKRVRSVVSPAFTSGKLRVMFGQIQEICKSVETRVGEAADSGIELDLIKLFSQYTLDAIARIAFSTRFDPKSHSADKLFEKAQRCFEFGFWQVLGFIFPSKFGQLFGVSIFDKDSVGFVFSLVRGLLRQRDAQMKAGQNGFADFLQIMMDAKAKLKEKDVNNNSATENGYMTAEEVEAQTLDLFLDVFITSSTMISFLLYQVAVREDIQERLVAEISDKIEDVDNVSADELNDMPYLNACVNENLRFYRAAASLERCASEDYALGETGVVVRKRQVVQIPVWAIHHSDEFYEEPHRFNPDRFMPENKDKLVPYTFIPFGAGPRVCTGVRLFHILIKLVTVKLLSKYRFEPTATTPDKLDFNFGVGLVLLIPKEPIRVVAKRR